MALVALAASFGCSGELIPTERGGGGSESDGGTTLAFRPTIQNDLDAVGCIAGSGCHGGDLAPMPLVPSPSSEDDWRANFDQVRARAGTPSTSLFMDKANGAGGHIAPLQPTDPMLLRWRAWIEAGAPYEPAAAVGDAGPIGPNADAGASGDAGEDGALTWEADIGPLLRARDCTDCHGANGGYSLESYSAALGFGSDGLANVVPGDPGSLLAIYCEQGHYELPYADALLVIEWIVEWQARER